LTLEPSVVLVAAWPTDWLTVLLVLVTKLVSPAYTAVIECDPTDSALVLNVAVPPLSVPVPIVVRPSLKVTLPLGVPAPGAVALTVAVKVTD
jgi:hypothetical protein